MRLRQFALQWIACMALWLLFVFQFSPRELLAGAAAAAFCVAALQAAFRAVPLCFQPDLRWLVQGFRLPEMIAGDLPIMFRALIIRLTCKRFRGVWRQSTFQTVDDCQGAAQRALTIFFLTTTPNSIVIDIDSMNSRLLLHELAPSPLPVLVKRLQE